MEPERTLDDAGTWKGPTPSSYAERDNHVANARQLRADVVAALAAGAGRAALRALRRLPARLVRWRQRHKTYSALIGCSDRVLAGIGIAREQIPLIARGIGPSRYESAAQAAWRDWAALRARLAAAREARRARRRVYRELMAYRDEELDELGSDAATSPRSRAARPSRARRHCPSWARRHRSCASVMPIADRRRRGAAAPARGAIRRLRPSERDQIRDHLLRLDPSDRLLRFGGQAGAAQITDYCDRLDRSRSLVVGYVAGAQVRGIGELELLEAAWPRAAELAVSVERRFRNRGIGTALLRRLVVAARNRLIGRLEMVCLIDNGRAVRMARRLGGILQLEHGEVLARIAPPWPTPWTWLEEALSESAVLALEPAARRRSAVALR